MMNESVSRPRHMIQRAQMAAVHIFEWSDHNLDVAPEAKFDGHAGEGGEGARLAQAKLLYQCKNTEEMKDGTLKSGKPCRKMEDFKEEERTHLRDVRTENRNQHVAIDFETATATKIPTTRFQAMVKGKGVYRRKGQLPRQLWKQTATMGEIEDMTELLTELLTEQGLSLHVCCQTDPIDLQWAKRSNWQ